MISLPSLFVLLLAAKTIHAQDVKNNAGGVNRFLGPKPSLQEFGSSLQTADPVKGKSQNIKTFMGSEPKNGCKGKGPCYRSRNASKRRVRE
ncbi:hypothetical protein BASA62_002731 [Batrachochytrium salamandrivorans]|nr:hypothetical protein BASA62_002731 [Batrachochytrium salamandrivorans]